MESEEIILEYLKPQGVTHVKIFKMTKEWRINKHEHTASDFQLCCYTEHLKSSTRLFQSNFTIIPVELYVPNPLRCFNCQRFGHHETTALLFLDQYVKIAELAVMTIRQASVRTQLNV